MSKRRTVTQQNAKESVNPVETSVKRQITNPVVQGLIKDIIEGSAKSDAEARAQGLQMRYLKTLVEAQGLMGGKTWHEWAFAVFSGRIDKSLLRLLNDLALAPDEEHRAVLLAHRTEGAKRAREWRARERQKKEKEKRMAIERQWIIRWAKHAPHADVKRAWKHLQEAFKA